jgi:hypothetical protein
VAKQNGLGFSIAVDDAAGSAQTISNGITNHQFATPRGVQDVTGVDSSGMERILLLADMSITMNGPFDPAADATHDVFKTVPSTSVARTTTLGIASKTLACEVLYTDYPLTRSAAGEFTFAVPGVLADGTVPTWS